MKIAITGGAGEGKSVVLRMISELGFRTIDADDVVDEIWRDEATPIVLAEILEIDHPVDKDDVRELVFRQPAARREINRFFHNEALTRLIESDAEFCEVPLLIETCSHPCFDQTWTVTCGPEEQRKRLSQRDISNSDIDRLLAVQLPTRVKQVFSQRVIRTDCSLSDVFAAVKEGIQHVPSPQ